MSRLYHLSLTWEKTGTLLIVISGFKIHIQDDFFQQKADGDDIGKEGHPDDVKVIDAFDNLKVDPGKPQVEMSDIDPLDLSLWV